jgi:hypothetical protein
LKRRVHDAAIQPLVSKKWEECEMRKVILAAVFSLAAMQSVPAVSGNELVVMDGRIAQFKAMLKLSADQERFWAPVEATLREMSRRPNAAAALDGTSVNQLLASALPLFQRLDPEQKRQLIAIARSLGILSLAVAFR